MQAHRSPASALHLPSASQRIAPHCDTEVFQVFFDKMATEVPLPRGKHVLLVLDNTSWQKTKSLRWRHIETIYLSLNTPDFNPIEGF